MYAISKCAFLLGFRFDIKFYKPAFLEENHQKVKQYGCGKGWATRRAQMVSPMMTVTVTNFEGANFEKFGNTWNSAPKFKIFKIAT